MGMHLSAAHNVVLLLSGAVAIYIGLMATQATGRTFCLVFGAVYGLFGLAGFVAGVTYGLHPHDRSGCTGSGNNAPPGSLDPGSRISVGWMGPETSPKPRLRLVKQKKGGCHEN